MNEDRTDGNGEINFNIENDNVAVVGISDKGCVRERNEDSV